MHTHVCPSKIHLRYRNFSAIFAALAKCWEVPAVIVGGGGSRREATRVVFAYSCKRLLSLSSVRQSLCKNKLLHLHSSPHHNKVYGCTSASSVRAMAAAVAALASAAAQDASSQRLTSSSIRSLSYCCCCCCCCSFLSCSCTSSCFALLCTIAPLAPSNSTSSRRTSFS